MARKPKHEEHENHERWLVSYADFITLLFAFFVVMYSISSVNEGKYRVLSSALVSAFSHPQRTVEPIQYGTPLRSPIIQHDAIVKDENTVNRKGVDYKIMPSQKEMAEMQKIADEIEHELQELIDQGKIVVLQTNQGLEIEIKSSVLFASGVAVLSSQAISPLKKIASVLRKKPNEINVEGYTDDVPISTEYYPSNWELSAARAASVVRLFTQSGLDPMRLKAIGFSQYQPVADNNTEEGRSKNRRVAIMVLNKPSDKRFNLSLNMKDKSKDRLKLGGKAMHSKPKSIPLTGLGLVGNNNKNDKNDKPKLLSQQPGNPAITTLPLVNPISKPLASSTQGGTPRQDQSGNTPPVAPKHSTAPINLPVLQVLPKGEGEQN